MKTQVRVTREEPGEEALGVSLFRETGLRV